MTTESRVRSPGFCRQCQKSYEYDPHVCETLPSNQYVGATRYKLTTGHSDDAGLGGEGWVVRMSDHFPSFDTAQKWVKAEDYEALRLRFEKACARVTESESAQVATTPQAPIAKVIVRDDGPADVMLYAPGLPIGEHDLYCEPPAPSGQKVPHPCFAPETKAPHFFHNDSPCRHCGKDASEHAVNMQCIGPAVKTPDEPLQPEEIPEPSLDLLKRVAERLRRTAPDTAPLAQWAVERIEELEANFEIRWKATMRAIERWQQANPGNDLVWPDYADLCVWLLEQLDKRPAPDVEAESP